MLLRFGCCADIFNFVLFYLSLLNNECVSQENKSDSKLHNERSGVVEGKIVGGRPVSIEKFPSAVLVFNFGSLCGGTIVNSWTIISAAHCFTHNKDPNQITIHVGKCNCFFSIWC